MLHGFKHSLKYGFKHSLKSSIISMLSKVGYAFGLGLTTSTLTLRYELERRAAISTADYVVANMSDAIIFNSHRELLDYAISRSPAGEMILEFGVYRAHTLNYIARRVRQKAPDTIVWGFDSFTGMPSDCGLVGASRPVVSTILNRLRDQGILDYSREYFCVREFEEVALLIES